MPKRGFLGELFFFVLSMTFDYPAIACFAALPCNVQLVEHNGTQFYHDRNANQIYPMCQFAHLCTDCEVNVTRQRDHLPLVYGMTDYRAALRMQSTEHWKSFVVALPGFDVLRFPESWDLVVICTVVD